MNSPVIIPYERSENSEITVKEEINSQISSMSASSNRIVTNSCLLIPDSIETGETQDTYCVPELNTNYLKQSIRMYKSMKKLKVFQVFG